MPGTSTPSEAGRRDALFLSSLRRISCSLLVAAVAAAAGWYVIRNRPLSAEEKGAPLRIGYAIEAPYAFLDAAGGVTGESPEIARVVAARLGFGNVEWRQTDFDALIPELEAGRIDVIAAGLFITPERARRVRFSIPTIHVQTGLLVAGGNPRNLHAYEDVLTRPELRLAVLSGAVEEGLVRRMGFSARQLLVVPDASTGRVAVESKLADGLALSAPTIRTMAMRRQLGKTEMAAPFAQPRLAQEERLGYAAFAFRREDRRLNAAWDNALRSYLGSPEHLALIARFGFSKDELPEKGITVEMLSR